MPSRLEPTRRIFGAEALDVDQQAGNAGARGRAIGLERIADEHDAGLEMSFDDGQIHHPIPDLVGHAEIAEIGLQSRQQAQNRCFRIATQLAHDRIGRVAEHEEICAHAGGHRKQAEIVDAVRRALAVTGQRLEIERRAIPAGDREAEREPNGARPAPAA